MTQTHKDFDFSALSAAERIRLAKDLLDSVLADTVSPPLPQWQIDEIRQRAAAIDSGEVTCIPWDDVRRRLQPSS